MSCNVLDTTVEDEKNRTSRVDCIGKVSSMTNSVVDFPATSYFCTFVAHDVQGASLVHHVHTRNLRDEMTLAQMGFSRGVEPSL